MAESFRTESNSFFYEWFLVNQNQWFTQANADSDSNTETKQKQHSCSCHIAEQSGACLLAHHKMSKLAACILKHLFKMLNKYMIDKNQVQSRYMLMNGIAFVIAKMLPETNYYTCSRSRQMNKTNSHLAYFSAKVRLAL